MDILVMNNKKIILVMNNKKNILVMNNKKNYFFYLMFSPPSRPPHRIEPSITFLSQVYFPLSPFRAKELLAK